MNLLIISHTPHYRMGTQVVGWGPTVREIDQLAKLFNQVHHLAVLYKDQPPQSSLPYSAGNVSFIPVRPAGGETLAAKLDVIRAYFGYWKPIGQAIHALGDNDMIHVRCPANLSLLAVLYLIFQHNPSRRWIKYAGNWKPEGHDSFTYALQRWLLKKDFARSVVTVNGRWPDQPKHIHSFYNPSLTIRDLPDELDEIHDKKLSPPFQILFVGNVTEAKGTGRAVTAALQLISSGLDVVMEVVGDGEQRAALEAQVRQARQQERFRFHGWLPPEAIAPIYDRAHFILLPSRTEGWPKVLSEAMAHGVVPLAGNISSIPQILEECDTGMAVDPLDAAAFANAILSYVNDPARWQRESQAGHLSAYCFSYEEYLSHLKTMYAEQWGLRL